MNVTAKTIYISVIFLAAIFFTGGGFSDRAKAQTDAVSNRPPMFVLQVGIRRYANAAKWAELEGSINDVEQMKILLTGERYKIPVENIKTLTDAQATKQKIFDEFLTHLIGNSREYYLKSKKRDAVVMFQFSGHGSQAPDVDGDETDGKDETFVTYDSQDAPGKNFDITDDEIFSLTQQLRQYTDNIVYIFDSCHSGSGTRDAEDARKIPERKTVPVTLLKSNLNMRGESKTNDGEQTDVLPKSDDYIVISAAKSEQLAGQKYYFSETDPAKPVVYGYLSFYLIEELKNARTNTSYRELMENVIRKVSADKPSQIPQLEGDASRFVFGALGSREENFSPIIEADEKFLTIKAGAMQGLLTGTTLKIYDQKATDFSQTEPIAAARITKVYADRATAMIGNKKRAITTFDKAVVGVPDLGALRLKVLLEADEAKLTADEKAVIQSVRTKLTPEKKGEVEPRGVDLIGNSSKNAKPKSWNVAVLKDSFAKVFPEPSKKFGENKALLPADKNIFYIAGNDYVPLYGFHVAADDAQAAEKIEKALVHLAKLRMVTAISNNRSTLKNKISVKPLRVKVKEQKCLDGKIAADTDVPQMNDAKTAYRVQPGERFWFEVANNSGKNLYISLLDIGSDGSVQVQYPRAIYEEKDGIQLAPGEKKIIVSERCGDRGLLGIGFPTGLETFKLIASTVQIKPEDFKYLEMTGIGQSRANEKSLNDLEEWTTIETVFEIAVPSAPKN